MADDILNNRNRNFWSEVKKVKCNGSTLPNNVDACSGRVDIANLFKDKYEQLYNTVSYNENDMSELYNYIDERISCICCKGECYHSHVTTVNEVEKAISHLKQGKSDGDICYSTDHIINGTNLLNIYLSLLFSSMITHGVTPREILLSTVVPIPKNKRKSVNDSDNFRGIALSSSIGKLLDWILLNSNRCILNSSDLQYGYKEGHSTTHCTFVLNEVVNYYNNHNSDVFVILLDATKAFDRVNYIKLFHLLLHKGICPLVARFLATLYTNQLVRIKWIDHLSDTFSVSNGVKQGGVLSPILFGVYIDELLGRLKSSSYGCHIGNMFFGALAYADDVTLLCPSRSSVIHMLNIANEYSKEYNVVFNHVKSNIIVYEKKVKCDFTDVENVQFDNSRIDIVENSKHLGNVIGKNDNIKNIETGTADFYGRVNMLLAKFRFAFPWIKYKLFKSFCMPLYGVQLWNLSCKYVNLFYVAWRKCIRRIFDLPQRTHSVFLNILCEDYPVEMQIHMRFLKFFHSIITNSNELIQRCGKLVLNGSCSVTCDNLNFVCNKYSLCKNHLSDVKVSCIQHKVQKSYKESVSLELLRQVGIISDLIYIREFKYNTHFTHDEIECLLNFVCTD